MPRSLSKTQLDSLQQWCAAHEVRVKNFGRDCSDGVYVARLLKQLHPQLVDLHNYPRQNSIEHKTTNWEMLNRKVLAKIGMPLAKEQIGKFVNCDSAAVAAFLYRLMRADEKARAELNKPVDEQEHQWSINDDVMMITVAKKVGDAILQVPQKMILFTLYEEAVKRAELKENELLSSKAVIKHLEKMLELKNQRIEELSAQVQRFQGCGDHKSPATATLQPPPV